MQYFTVYQENDRFLSIPKFYGFEKLGEPDKNVELKDALLLNLKVN